MGRWVRLTRAVDSDEVVLPGRVSRLPEFSGLVVPPLLVGDSRAIVGRGVVRKALSHLLGQ